ALLDQTGCGLPRPTASYLVPTSRILEQARRCDVEARRRLRLSPIAHAQPRSVPNVWLRSCSAELRDPIVPTHSVSAQMRRLSCIFGSLERSEERRVGRWS